MSLIMLKFHIPTTSKVILFPIAGKYRDFGHGIDASD